MVRSVTPHATRSAATGSRPGVCANAYGTPNIPAPMVAPMSIVLSFRREGDVVWDMMKEGDCI